MRGLGWIFPQNGTECNEGANEDKGEFEGEKEGPRMSVDTS